MLRKVLAALAAAVVVGAAPGVAAAGVPSSVNLPPAAVDHVGVTQDSGTLIIA